MASGSERPPVDAALIEAAIELTHRAGELTMQWFRTAELRIETKDDGSPVTAADRAAEEYLREELERRFPDDSVIGEEHADKAGSSGRTWLIDPIDGTRAFTRGVPLFTNLLALVDHHGPAVGVAHAPAAGETVAAGRGRGCTLNGLECGVSAVDNLDAALVTTSGYDYWPANQLAAVHQCGAELRTWGDGYGYILVASGRADVMVDPGLKRWDVAPMNVIIAEAGGRLTTFGGAPDPMEGDVVATNELLHEQVLRLLRA